MANTQLGYELNQHITNTLNDLITTTGKQIDKDEPKIWAEFLHEVTNDDWDAMFSAFKDAVDKNKIFLTNHQQLKFDEAYTTFKRDSQKRERCMDIRNKYKNTKAMSWAMIMVIREVWNQINKVEVKNVDAPVTVIKTKGQQQKIEIRTTKEATHITVFHDLFDISD